jgi:NADH:ubiquinone oxidoreductase subunit E
MTFHPKIDYRELHRSARKLPHDDGQPFAYSGENRARLEEICRRYPPEGRRSAILPALFLVQRQHGYISLNAIPHVAEAIGCTAADVEDVVSFYTMFYTQPMGKFVVQVCRTLPCALRGAERVTEELTAALGTEPNGTDPTGTFTLVEVECLGRVRSRAAGDGERQLARVPGAGAGTSAGRRPSRPRRSSGLRLPPPDTGPTTD